MRDAPRGRMVAAWRIVRSGFSVPLAAPGCYSRSLSLSSLDDGRPSPGGDTRSCSRGRQARCPHARYRASASGRGPCGSGRLGGSRPGSNLPGRAKRRHIGASRPHSYGKCGSKEPAYNILTCFGYKNATQVPAIIPASGRNGRGRSHLRRRADPGGCQRGYNERAKQYRPAARGLHPAAQGQKESKPMKSRLLVGMMVAVMLLAAALPVAAQDPEQDCFNKGGVWNADEQRCVISIPVEVRIDYPLDLATAYPVVENAVDSILAKERAAFLEPIADPEFVNYSPGPLTLDIQYETVGFSPDHLSLNLIIYTFSGGAHGMTYF